MISRVTGEIEFRSGFRISPHCSIESLAASAEKPLRVQNQRLSLKPWKRHVLGSHPSEHGTFEVEALSADDGCIHLVLLSHQHPFYEANTAEDADRRAFHEGVIGSDLGGQREFSWGEVVCRLEMPTNKDWLIIAYNRAPRIPLPERTVLLRLLAHENLPGSG